MLLRETCWQWVLAPSSSFSLNDGPSFFFFALRWVEVFQGCFCNMFQTQLSVQAASLPASCVFYQTLDASLGYIYVVVLVA